jgi:hypothetical protein
MVQQLVLFRKKGNIVGYERPGAISDLEADEMISLAQNSATS